MPATRLPALNKKPHLHIICTYIHRVCRYYRTIEDDKYIPTLDCGFHKSTENVHTRESAETENLFSFPRIRLYLTEGVWPSSNFCKFVSHINM
jgi:hypothetical protein